MKTFYISIIFCLLIILNSCGPENKKQYVGYTDLEIETEMCIDKMFKTNKVDWLELKTIFEGYFSDGQISNENDPIEKQYEDILSYLERPTKRYPIFRDKQKVIRIIEKLGIKKNDIFTKTHLNCFTDKYIENKSIVDITSSFYAFGSSLETIRKVPNLSIGVISGAIKMSMKKNDLEKELYQKTIVLMFCFDMTLFLTD